MKSGRFPLHRSSDESQEVPGWPVRIEEKFEKRLAASDRNQLRVMVVSRNDRDNSRYSRENRNAPVSVCPISICMAPQRSTVVAVDHRTISFSRGACTIPRPMLAVIGASIGVPWEPLRRNTDYGASLGSCIRHSGLYS